MKRLAVFSLIPLLAACNRHPTQLDKSPMPVRVASVELFQPMSDARYSASLMPDRQVSLSFRVSSLVESVRQVRSADGRLRSVDISDLVPQGAELARVRVQDYQLVVDQITGQINQARQNEQTAHAQLADCEAAFVRAGSPSNCAATMVIGSPWTALRAPKVIRAVHR